MFLLEWAARSLGQELKMREAQVGAGGIFPHNFALDTRAKPDHVHPLQFREVGLS